ncbi:MAG: efflux RND transporter periplasmic adaptor subunit [bacterium]
MGFLEKYIFSPIRRVVYTVLRFFWRFIPKFVKNNKTANRVKEFVKKENKTRRDWVIIIVAIIVVLFIAWQFFSPKGKKVEYTYATITKNKIVSSVSVTGDVKAKNDKTLTFGSAGTVKRVDVEVGDQVKKGDFLAQIDTTNLEASLTKVKAGVKSAEISLKKLQRGDDVDMQQLNVAMAQLSLDSAKINNDTLLSTLDLSKNSNYLNVATSNKSLADLQSDLEKTERDTAQDVALAKAAEEIAKQQFDTSQNSYQHGATTRGSLDVAELQWKQATEQRIKVELARDTAVDNAKKRLLSSQLSRNVSALGADISDKNLDANKATSQKNLEKAQNSLENASLQLQQVASNKADSIADQQAKIEQAKADMTSAEDALKKAKLYAPFDGVIISVAAEEGETFPSGAGGASSGASTGGAVSSGFIQIADVTTLQVEVNVSETDIVDIQPGLKVSVSFDAIPTETFDGVISKVDPGPTVVQGVVNYKVTITFPQNPKIRLGMTANLDIITAEKDSTLSVPFRAIEEKDGKKYVKVKRNGQLVRQEVKTGVQSDTNIEITNGLEDGETIAY